MECVTATAAVTVGSWAVKESELLLLNHGEYVTVNAAAAITARTAVM